MLQNEVLPHLRRFPDFGQLTFQQDGAPIHCTRAVKDFLHQTFQNRVISRGMNVPPYNGQEWPPRSPG